MAAADATVLMSPERAALRAALRRGDALNAARAWEKLRVAAQSITTHERNAGRDARKVVGRAIRDARYRRMQTAMDAFTQPKPVAAEAEAAGRSRRRPVAIAVAAMAIVALLIVFLATRPENEDYAPAAAAPAEVAQPTVAPTANVGGRGRTRETAPPVALVTPVPADTAAPTASASPTTGPTGAPGATEAAGAQPGGVAGGVTGGVTGGQVGGTVGGTIGGTGTKTLPPATPTPYILPRTPPQLPPGQDRFLFRVIDQATGAPLFGVCVNYGFPICGPADPHTNVDGLYWLDLNPGMATAWNFRFALDGYLVANLNKTYRPGTGITTTTVFLRKQ